ncbi:NitT/TauT family transport system ATP-binding protein [Ereboglobus sp. PH5-10]|uniref:ABC transporter ATP-binding protein n=1 Tax=Ereboglobus sp. PH5-10 TaxID=2940629 RepID=UPI0024060095|nr:ABC transporter ATP-binding protein [Ereboglobus sp. PH5-10]MDF9827542.1 NitT/TauT family transport system ATP-binding protein [Ereboglobus sp. PH5-10]
MGIQQELENEAPSKLSVRNISKIFHSKHQIVRALDGVSLEINEGEFVCLVGPSGCGKSTLLNIIAGLDQADEGSVLSDGQRISGPGRDRMVMFQEHALFPWLDVLDNVMFGLRLKPNLKTNERREVAKYYLHLVGLDNFLHANIHELSGGMKQRVALARALAPNPKVLLMDEPFGALDALTREQLYRDIQRIWAQRKKTIVFVTHNVREAVCLGDRVVLFSPHPGRIRHEYPITLPRPRDINSVSLAEKSGEILQALKGYLNDGVVTAANSRTPFNTDGAAE